MTVINICARDYRLIIGSLDCSAGVVAGSVSQSQYSSQTGLVTTKATFTLRQTLDFTPDLDDRTNAQWQRKTPIFLEIANTSGTLQPAPVGAVTWITDAEYDGRGTLVINSTCVLGLLDAATPPGPALDVEPGQTISGGAILGQISQRLGGIQISGNLPTSWQAPTSKVDNRSYVKFLGALCWANGRIAYSNGTAITIIPVNLYPSPLLTRWVDRDAVEHGRLTGAERPCEVVRVTGVALVVNDVPDDNEDENTEYATVASLVPRTAGTPGGNEVAIAAIVKTTNSRNQGARTETDLIEARRARILVDPRVDPDTNSVAFLTALVQAETTTTIRRYESQRTPDEGRLLTEISETMIAGVFALKNYNENLPPELQVNPGTDQIIQSQTTTTHIYQFLDRDSRRFLSGNRVQYRRITETIQAKGVAFPSIHFSWCAKSVPYEIVSGNTTIKGWRLVPSQNPLDLIVTDRVVVEYRERQPGAWEEITTTYRASVDQVEVTVYSNVNGEVCYSGTPPDPLPPGVVATNLTSGTAKLVQTNQRTRRGPQVQPPAPTRFGATISTTETPITGEVLLPPIVGGNLQDRERDYPAEVGMIRTKAQAQAVARIEGAILLGRHKGVNFALDCANPLFNYRPLAAMDWVEGGKIQRYLIDGLSLGLTNRRAIAAADGIWVGTVGIADPLNPPTANPTPPDPEDTTETPPPILPYRPVTAFAPAMGSHTQLKTLPFATSRTFSFVSRSGHFFGGLSRIGDAPVVTVGSDGASDPVIRGAGDAPVVTVGSDGANSPALPSGDAPVVTVGTDSATAPQPSGDAPIAALGSDSASNPVAGGDAATTTLGSQGA